ncbi:MAG: HD domain-containing protein [Lachnospiraceae bacterium]|nr:HD domain-containing protein [Candidatus Merdinaster equi]
MQILNLLCLSIALGMMLWLKIFDVRNSITQFINVLVMVISILGYYFISVSTSLDEALIAQKVAYVGGVFLPIFYFFLVMEICHIEPKKIATVIMVMIQIAVFAFVCTIGQNDLFYKSAKYYSENGMVILEKEYGPLHTVFQLTMYFYLFASIGVAVYTLIKKRAVNRRGLLAMVILAGVAVGSYVIEKAIHFPFELIPIAYVTLMLGALIPVYDSNIYTVYENKDIVGEQLGKVGFLIFDAKRNYKGCNIFFANVFPEISEAVVGKPIVNCGAELQSLIDQIVKVEDAYKKNSKRKHVHVHITPFLLNERHYDGLVHVLANPFGKLKGYTIELRDDTDHYTALSLQESYNEKLEDEVEEKTKKIRLIQQKTILGMARMVESRDLSTGGHIKRTSDVVRIFAKKLVGGEDGLDKRFLELVIRSAPMHDLGKIGVDDAILRKQGRFTDEEYAAMKQHSEIGYHMVKEILADVEEPDFVRVAENVAHYHHEKVDGTGYPHGLKGEEIPLEARIMALADVFDALVSKRCYKEAFSYDKAFEIIQKDSGTHFDKKLADVFLTCRPELEEYYNNEI